MRIANNSAMRGDFSFIFLKYFFAWFGMMILAIINGGIRDFAYKSLVGDLPAHHLFTVTLIVLIAAYLWLLTSIWPIKSSSEAWIIGGVWFVMTEAFEFGVGRFVSGDSWSTLFDAYNVFAGQVWVFIPLWVLIGPYVFFRFVQDSESGIRQRPSKISG